MHWRSAQYVRMSTEHQQYSTENQRDKIREYAAKRGIEIVHSPPPKRTGPNSDPMSRIRSVLRRLLDPLDGVTLESARSLMRASLLIRDFKRR